MLARKIREEQVEENNPILNNDAAFVSARDACPEPAWLRNAPSLAQDEDASATIVPLWLKQFQAEDGSSNITNPTKAQVANATEDIASEEALVSALRQRFQEADNEPQPSYSQPGTFAQVNLVRGVQNRLLRYRHLIVGGVLGITLLCVVGWMSFGKSSFLALAVSTAVAQKQTTPTRLIWPATWTWTPTQTRIAIATPTSTRTSTLTPPTRVLPTRTLRPPTATANPFAYITTQRGCQHSGGTFIEGTVKNLSGEVVGAQVSLGNTPGGNPIQTIVTGRDKSPGYYIFILRANGSYPGTFYVWVTDTAGKPLSDPNAGRVTTNAIKNSEDPASCWQAFVDFIAVR